MNSTHVLDFVVNQLAFYQVKHDNTVAEYAKQMAEYKALSAFKRFFANNPETDYWHFYTYNLRELKEIKRKAEYNCKMKYDMMDIPERWHNAFYKWAEDNNIPY